jgi:hypothetical protein
MHEFRDDTRDIYKIQLFIDHKHRELRELEREQRKAERELAADIARIPVLEDEYKKSSIQIAAAVARKTRMAEVAQRTLTEKRKEFHAVQQETELIRSAIVKNEGFRQTHSAYRDFLAIFRPRGIALTEFFTCPTVLLDDLHRIENENLFIIQHYNHLSEVFAASIASLRFVRADQAAGGGRADNARGNQ